MRAWFLVLLFLYGNVLIFVSPPISCLQALWRYGLGEVRFRDIAD
jgi:hypothetical protein